MRNFTLKTSYQTHTMTTQKTGPTQSKYVKIIIWANIAFQFFFPLSLSFTPVIASAQKTQSSFFSGPTQIYTLGTNENVDSVAKKHGLTLSELKDINRYRTFSKPFDKLTTGDEIDIPRPKSPFSVDNQKGNNTNSAPENALANHMQYGATALSGKNTTKSGERMLRSAASNEFNASTQQWLSQFGTARVQMNIDDNFTINNSAVDVLLPFYDRPNTLSFTQLGARNQDSRNTINIGAGIRTFKNNWMYGANTFYDNDLTGNNQRIGIGTEAWTDYLKLSANSYFRITDWHQSRDFADYNERPANGYDVRAEAYLPLYPQLGGTLMYEKYRGDDVALFSKDQRQKNPHAVTAGINYTPIPLLTVGADHRAGKGGSSDSKINFQLNYRLGESWRSHIDPSAVAASRTLSGSRYDLVERNNNIVLDYQKQELLRLTLPERISGEGGSSTSISANVTSKYALDRIEWDSSSLNAAGGSLSQVSIQTVDIKLPPYQLSRAGEINVHTLSAVAFDNQGNRSPRATIRITVMPGVPTLTDTSLTVVNNNAIADGLSTNTVRAIVTDTGNNPLPGQVVTFTAGNGAMITTTRVTTNNEGSASTTLTNTQAGVASVTATLANNASQSVDTRFVADDSTAVITTENLTVTKDNAIADGSDFNSVKAVVTDAHNNPLSSQTVTFTAGNGASVTPLTATTGPDGIVTATLTNTLAGVASVTATLANNASLSVNTRFVADDSTAVITTENLTVTKDNAIADGSDFNSVKAVVTDAHNNPLSGQTVTFTAGNGASVTPLTATTGPDGIVTATFTNTQAGVASVTATLANNASQSVDTRFVADDSTAVITTENLTVTKDNAIADGSDFNSVKAVVTDAHNNPLSGQTVTFTAGNGASVTPLTATTGPDGIVTATLTNTQAGVASVTATLANNASLSVNTRFVADDSTAVITTENLTITKDNAIADGSDFNSVKAVVTDAHNNPLTGQTVTFTAGNGASVTPLTATTGPDGIVTATLTNTLAGVASVTATLANNASLSVNTRFVADDSTAVITTENLTITKDNAIADGSDFNSVKAVVTDAHNNPLAGQTVTFTAGNGASVTPLTATTGPDGIVTATLTNTQAGVASVTATLANNASLSVNTRFVADDSTAVITTENLTITKDNAIADGSDFNSVKAVVTDAHNNPLTGQTVTFTAGNGASVTPLTATTGPDGIVTATLTNTLAGVASVTATLANNASQSVNTRFVADDSTAVITTENLTITKDNAIADGSDFNSVKAVVTDAHNNPLTGQTVTFTAGNGASVTPLTATTGPDGIVTATLTNTQAGVASVTATLANNASLSVNTRFVADDSTAVITTENLTITKDNAIADGSDFNSVKAVVTDAHNNPLAGQTVTFTAGNGASVTPLTATTGPDGIVTATLTNTLAGVASVTATLANNASQSVNTRFVADDSTAMIKTENLTVTKDNAIADGSDFNSVKAVVTDAHNNPLTGQTVTFTAGNGASVTPLTATTGADGIVTATLTNTNPGQTAVTAKLSNNASQSVNITFIQNLSISVETTADKAIAGEENNTVKAKVVDDQGNPAANVKVNFSSEASGITLTPSSGTTNANGEVSASVYRDNSTGGSFSVTAEVSGQTTSDSATVSFLTLRTVSNIIAPNNYTFSAGNGFPTTAYPNATFQINASGNVASNITYTWSSSDSSSASVDSAGNVTLAASVLNKPINIIAKDNINAYRYTFRVTRWFYNLSGLKNHANTEQACQQLGMQMPEYAHLTKGQNNRQIGSLWSEWGLPSGWSPGNVNTGYWTVTGADPGLVYLVIMSHGGYITKDSNGAYIEYGVCTKS